MKNYMGTLALAVLAGLSFYLVGCGNDSVGKNNVVALKVNNAVTTIEEFNALITKEAYVDPEMDLTAETRDQFVEYLIGKELMIDEAVQLKLDREDKFIKTIEKYWESTLIRDLLAMKAEEFKKQVLITDDEIKACYIKYQARFGPLEQSKEEIRDTLCSQKLEVKMEEWTSKLRESADITVNDALINGN
jgi:hypothetical protein